MKCPKCGNEMIFKRVSYNADGIPLGKFEAYVCYDDDTIFFTEESSRLIELAEKEIGIWGVDIPKISIESTTPFASSNHHTSYQEIIFNLPRIPYFIMSTN